MDRTVTPERGSGPPAVNVVCAAEASPLALALAESLRRGSVNERVATAMRRMRGRVTLRSAKDSQAATLVFSNGRVEVLGGADPSADLVITADLDRLNDPSAKPKVKGLARHPLFALLVNKVLDSPSSGTWVEAAHQFWRRTAGAPGMPGRLRIVADDGRDIEFGIGGDQLELHGPASALNDVLTGQDHAGLAWFEGRVRMLGPTPVISRFVGVSQKLMFGQL